MYIPIEQFNFKIHEGTHLVITFSPDKNSELKLKKEIKDLQQDLLNDSDYHENL